RLGAPPPAGRLRPLPPGTPPPFLAFFACTSMQHTHWVVWATARAISSRYFRVWARNGSDWFGRFTIPRFHRPSIRGSPTRGYLLLSQKFAQTPCRFLAIQRAGRHGQG